MMEVCAIFRIMASRKIKVAILCVISMFSTIYLLQRISVKTPLQSSMMALAGFRHTSYVSINISDNVTPPVTQLLERPYHEVDFSSFITSFANDLRRCSRSEFPPRGDVSGTVNCPSTMNKTDLKVSKVSMLPRNSAADDTVAVVIVTYTGSGQRKHTGGDVIVLWAEQVRGDGLSPGEVSDHMNGTYSGMVRVFWSGKTVIKAKLVSSNEDTCRRWNAIQKYRNSMFAMQEGWGIHALYQQNSLTERTRCGTSDYIEGLQYTCNFTELNDGQRWYCGAPTKARLNCGHVYSFVNQHFNRKFIVPNQSDTEVIIKPGHGVFTQSVSLYTYYNVHKHDGRLPVCSRRPRAETWTENSPSGYVLDGKWHIHGCKSPITFSAQSCRECLANRYIYLIGDSTVRQYMEYFLHAVLGFKNIALHDVTDRQRRLYSHNGRFVNYNITIDYKKHAMPFHNYDFPTNGIAAMPTEIDKLAQNNIDGESEFLIINYNVHLQAFPPEEFDLRIRNISMAVKRLLRKKPNITVLFKGPNIAINDERWFDSRLALLFRDIVYRHFRDLKDRVIYLDVWSITVAHNSDFLHPIGGAFRSQIQQLMAYMCL